MLFILASTIFAQDYELPEVIGHIYGLPPDTLMMGLDFCNVGDQNGDGCDDLLVSHFPFSVGNRFEETNQIKLYYGGRDGVDNEPDWILSGEDRHGIGYPLIFLGNISPNFQPIFATVEKFWANGNNDPGAPNYYRTQFFEGFGGLDREPDIIMQQATLSWKRFGSGLFTRSFDLNSDGFEEFIMTERNEDIYSTLIYFGGEELDTLPDWRTSYLGRGSRGYVAPANYSGGFDVNGDNIDDLLLSRGEIHNDIYKKYFHLFIGGAPVDTVPVFSFTSWDMEGILTDSGFSLLPDVNGDGYDDWAIAYWAGHETAFWLFFGSENPQSPLDHPPDLLLEPFPGISITEAWVCGGDFNGDGYGDIVGSAHEADINAGVVHIYFGGPDISRDADIQIRGRRDYEGRFLRIGDRIGAVGDYNGDGIDDFVCRTKIDPTQWSNSLVIFAGNREWPGAVDEKPVPESYKLMFDIHPNPFNRSTQIRLNLPICEKSSLSVYDVRGRLVETLIEDRAITGSRIFTYKSDKAGVYFVVLEGEYQREVRKVVCLR